MDGESKMNDEGKLILDYLENRSVDEHSSLIEIITALISLPIKYSDILIHEDSPIMLRMSRGWVEAPLGDVIRSKIEEFFGGMDTDWAKKLLPDNPDSTASKKLNFSRDMKEARVRCNGFVHGDRKLGMAIRRIPKEIPTLAEIGLPMAITDICQKQRGLILITGPVGNGKSTTMAAILNYINNLKCGHIVTLEDPLEFIHVNTKSIFTQREIPKHASTFKEGFEEALRERPDVIAIGELRNKDTVETCLEGSDAGLLMLATMHANNASSAIEKFLNFYSDTEVKQKAAKLSNSLIAVVSQTLVPSKDGAGAELAYEILLNSPQVAQAIALMQSEKTRALMTMDPTPGARLKSNTLNQSLADLVKRDKVSKVDAMNFTYDSQDLDKELTKTR